MPSYETLIPAESAFPVSRKKMIRELQKLGLTKKQAQAHIRDLKSDEVYANSEHVVTVRRDAPNGFGVPCVEISIRRQDREPIMDWRVMQRIKNAIVGAECEAIQLFPAESRLVDTSNQYWLYAFADPSARVPVGFTERAVSEESDVITGQRQRPFDVHD